MILVLSKKYPKTGIHKIYIADGQCISKGPYKPSTPVSGYFSPGASSNCNWGR